MKRCYFYLLTLSLILLLFIQVSSLQSYKFNTTNQQIFFWQKSLFYIQQHTGKRCTNANIMIQQRFCKKRCQLLYQYIPDAPYKNYRYYNKTTKDCEPRTICPPIYTVIWNQTLNKCIDKSAGDIVQGVDAKPPVSKNKTLQVEFVCVNGYVGYHKGRKQCICYFGWKTQYQLGDNFDNKYRLCNKGISIYEYLPVSVQIFYDPLLDLTYPHPADSQYWGKLFVYYLKKYKLQFLQIFWPIQVELVLLMVPKQSLFRDEDLKWIILAAPFLIILFFVTLYQKLVNSRTMQEIIADGQNIEGENQIVAAI